MMKLLLSMLAIIIGSTGALKCYHATTNTTGYTGKELPPIVDCATVVPNVTQNVELINKNKPDACVEHTIIHGGISSPPARFCGLKEQWCDGKIGCKETAVGPVKTETCCCDTDQCNNNGNTLTSSIMLLAVSLVFAIILSRN